VRYDNLRAFEKHLESATPQHFSPLYAVMGKESFDCKEALHLLLRFLVPSNQKEMALKILDGSSSDTQSLMEDLYSQSFLVDKRVILINHADKIKKNLWEKLEKYICRPLPAQYLILSGIPLSRQTSMYKLLEKEGIILEFADLKPWEKEKKLIEWVSKQATVSRKLMSYQVCQQFVKQLGTDQELLANELEKLLCFVGNRQEIVVQDIYLICTQIQLESVWHLGEAIFRRDSALALKITKSILLEQAFLPFLRQIRNQFVTEYHICMMIMQGRESSAITQEYPYMKGQILEKHIENARLYGMEAFKQGLLEIDATEVRAKNSQIDEQLLAEILITKLTRKNQ
jgi:DNA polymerase-3 subunit delta